MHCATSAAAACGVIVSLHTVIYLLRACYDQPRSTLQNQGHSLWMGGVRPSGIRSTFTTIDVAYRKTDPCGQTLIERFHIAARDLPIVLCPNGQLLRNPSDVELARCRLAAVRGWALKQAPRFRRPALLVRARGQ